MRFSASKGLCGPRESLIRCSSSIDPISGSKVLPTPCRASLLLPFALVEGHSRSYKPFRIPLAGAEHHNQQICDSTSMRETLDGTYPRGATRSASTALAHSRKTCWCLPGVRPMVFRCPITRTARPNAPQNPRVLKIRAILNSRPTSHSTPRHHLRPILIARRFSAFQSTQRVDASLRDRATGYCRVRRKTDRFLLRSSPNSPWCAQSYRFTSSQMLIFSLRIPSIICCASAPP